MLKLRFQRKGKKKHPFYRLVIIEQLSPRNGRTIDEVGFYSPVTKIKKINFEKINKWLKYGVKPTQSVSNLINSSIK